MSDATNHEPAVASGDRQVRTFGEEVTNVREGLWLIATAVGLVPGMPTDVVERVTKLYGEFNDAMSEVSTKTPDTASGASRNAENSGRS